MNMEHLKIYINITMSLYNIMGKYLFYSYFMYNHNRKLEPPLLPDLSYRKFDVGNPSNQAGRTKMFLN